MKGNVQMRTKLKSFEKFRLQFFFQKFRKIFVKLYIYDVFQNSEFFFEFC